MMTRARTRPRTPATAWVGWVWFAAVMLIMNGAFSALYGLVALFDDKYYGVSPNGLLVFDLTGWGWALLIFGIISVLAGSALLSGATWARVVAVVVAAINAIGHMAFASAYPVWALIVIAIDVLVIWAVIAHGEEIRDWR
jgi:hypothetical protein